MIKTEYHQASARLLLSENNKDAEIAFLEDFLYEIPMLLSNESNDPFVDKDRILSEVNQKYGSSFEYQDFGNLFLCGEPNVDGSRFDFYGDELNGIVNVRHLALTIQAYFRKFRSYGFLGVECYDDDRQESFALFISSENIETISLKDIIAQKKKQHDDKLSGILVHLESVLRQNKPRT